MAKRAVDNTPYRPLLDSHLVSAAIGLAPSAPMQEEKTPVKKVVAPVVDSMISESTAPSLPSDRLSVSQPARQPVANQAPIVEKFDQEKRILFTRSENQALDRLVFSLACRLNTQVKTSHLIRAVVSLLLHAEDEIDKRAGEVGALTRPPNGDPKALQRFERELASIVSAALRDAGPLREA